MAKEYHRVTSETIPVPSDNRPKMERQPPRSHYSTESGEWDGQLTHAELVHSATPDYPNYPGPVARRQWATKVGIAFNLSAGERSVLQAYAHDSGTPNGCWKAGATIGYELGYTEDFVGDARAKLVKLDILKYAGLQKRAKRFTLNFDVTWPDTGSEKSVTRSDTGLQRDNPDTNPGVTPSYKDVTRSDTRVKPGVTPGKLKVTENREREDNNISLSFSSISNSGSPGLTPGYRSQSPTTEDLEIERLVVDNWPVLKDFWNHQGGATTTYRKKGFAFTVDDIAEKRQKTESLQLAARTCVHCRTVRDRADEVKTCPRCEEPICVDVGSSCRQNSCFRQQGGNRQPRGPSDLHRR